MGQLYAFNADYTHWTTHHHDWVAVTGFANVDQGADVSRYQQLTPKE